MNRPKAIGFVRANGSSFELARLNRILGQDFDRQEVINGFSAIQNPDGGFPYGDRAGFPSCLSNTTMALQTLFEMRLGDSEPAVRGLGFIRKSKGKDGTWGENPKVAPLDPPFWDMPGDEDSTTWLTAAAADILVMAGKKPLKATLAYLAARQGQNGKFMGFVHTSWIALSLFGREGRDRKVWQAALGYLESADIQEWDASCMAWCLGCMRRGGVPKSSPLWARLLDSLSETQEDDGAWPSEGGAGMRVRDANSVLHATRDLVKI